MRRPVNVFSRTGGRTPRPVHQAFGIYCRLRAGEARVVMNANGLRKVCDRWPGVTESVKWEDDLVFSVANKMFVVTALRGPHRDRMSFKVDPDRFLELTDQPGMIP